MRVYVEPDPHPYADGEYSFEGRLSLSLYGVRVAA